MALRKIGGFSLLELMAVILVIAIISVVAYPRFADSDIAAVQTARDQILSAVTYAQQTAMARSSASNTIQLVVNSNSLDVTENRASLQPYQGAYLETLPTGVVVTSGTGTLTFDKLGRADSARSITLSRGGTSTTIQVEASGYAHY